jgi:ClpP class serine protease
MYVASAADKVFATDISLIGSVGVLIPPQFNLTQLMEKVGVQSLTISDGLNKDSLNPFRPWKKGEEDNIKEAVQYFYKEFVGLVTSARPQLDRTKLIDEYGANVYPAPLAKEYGYIDVSGASYDVALKALAEKISIEDDYYQVVELTHTTWLSELVKTRNNLLQGNITHTFDFGAEFSPGLRNKFLYLYCP